MKLLLDAKANPRSLSADQRWTPLHLACKYGFGEASLALVRAGADLDAQNEQGQTAMHFAHAYGYRELAEYLVRKGANPMVVNRHGLRPDQGLSPDRLL